MVMIPRRESRQTHKETVDGKCRVDEKRVEVRLPRTVYGARL